MNNILAKNIKQHDLDKFVLKFQKKNLMELLEVN